MAPQELTNYGRSQRHQKTSSVSDTGSTAATPSLGNAASNRATGGASASFDAQKAVNDSLCLSQDSEPKGGVGGFLQSLKDGLFGSDEDKKRQECLEKNAQNRAEIQKMMEEDCLKDNQKRDEILKQMLERGQR